MQPLKSIEQNLVDVVSEAIRGYELTPLVVDMIKFMLKSVYEGLILIDKESKIQFMDKCSEKVFGLEPGGAKNHVITDLLPDQDIGTVLRTGVSKISIEDFKGEKRIILKLPIKKNGKVIGVLGRGVLHRIEEIESLHKEIESLRVKIAYYKGEVKQINSAYYTFEDLLGISQKFRKAKQLAVKLALTEANVLLEGESGTGKELFAHSIHSLSNRKDKPFIRVNCPSIPFELAESELFGYEKGAFSGARNEGKPGKFELSEGGTILLDEIGSLPLTIQAKLLRVLQEKEIERLGGRNTIKVNFRLIAATNVNLSDLVAKERFRADLFYRLNTLPLKIPPLRERLEDIGLLIDHFLEKISKGLGTSIPRISDDALEILTNYKWPGNIRELTNVLEQSILNILLQQAKVIQAENLPSYILEKRYLSNENDSCLRSIVRDAEKQAIKGALLVTKGNKRKAARLLGIQRCVLYQKLNKYRSL